MSRRTRELKQELEVPHEGTSEVFFKYQEVSRARAGDLLNESLDDTLALEVEPLDSPGPAPRSRPMREEARPPSSTRSSLAKPKITENPRAATPFASTFAR